MYTVECPYCDHENEICDPHEYPSELECEACEKTFNVEAEYDPSFYASKDCSLNNEEHALIEASRHQHKDTTIIQYVCGNCDFSKTEFIELEKIKEQP